MRQELKTIIAKMKAEAIAAGIEYAIAETKHNGIYKQVLVCEHKYNLSNENEEIGQQLDKLYDEQYKAHKAEREAEDKLEAIQEALEHLKEAFNIIEEMEM